MVLRPADIRAFVARDWEGLETSKARYWQSLGRGGLRFKRRIDAASAAFRG